MKLKPELTMTCNIITFTSPINNPTTQAEPKLCSAHHRALASLLSSDLSKPVPSPPLPLLLQINTDAVLTPLLAAVLSAKPS
jgi:hypothetical protein